MFENVKEALRARLRPSSTHLTALRGDLQSRLRHFKAFAENFVINDFNTGIFKISIFNIYGQEFPHL